MDYLYLGVNGTGSVVSSLCNYWAMTIAIRCTELLILLIFIQHSTATVLQTPLSLYQWMTATVICVLLKYLFYGLPSLGCDGSSATVSSYMTTIAFRPIELLILWITFLWNSTEPVQFLYDDDSFPFYWITYPMDYLSIAFCSIQLFILWVAFIWYSMATVSSLCITGWWR